MHVDAARLRDHVVQLANRPRPAESAELAQARNYVAGKLRGAGWSVDEHPFRAVSDAGSSLEGVNLCATFPRQVQGDLPWFCVGAHVDSLPNTPGADDNASAVAALLEIARILPDMWPAQPRLNLELVAFDLEENGMLGGAEHARRCRLHRIDLRGMVSLEMLGYCNHAPRSQQLPRTLVGQYPDTANFIAVIGNQNSGPLIERFRTGMQRVETLAVETLQVPQNGNLLQATRLSDHSPFWDAGYPALMITDTSFLRNPHYHTPTDTLETLNLEFLHLVAEGCLLAVRDILAEGC